MHWIKTLNLGLVTLILAVVLTGCLSPAAAQRLSEIDREIAALIDGHNKGELTTQEFQTALGRLKTEVQDLSDQDTPWWVIGISIGGTVLLRLLGVPGLASSSGVNLVSGVRGIFTKATGNGG